MTTDWKLIELKHALDRESLGNKAVGLGELKRSGFRVPPGWVLPKEAVDQILAQNNLTQSLAYELTTLNPDNTRAVAQKIQALTQSMALSAELVELIEGTLNAGEAYAVRSSGTLEDMDDASFAGQYDSFLNVAREKVAQRICDCIRSMWREPILSYLVHQGINPTVGGMAVIIQVMVPAEAAGVLFSINPTTGADTEVVIEAVRGLGDALVSGKLNPEHYRYDWLFDQGDLPQGETILSSRQIKRLAKGALAIQKMYGFPVDVEFALADDRFYVLQTRPVTKINFSGLRDQWSTADFKDGGVSAAACKPLMWSLYEYIWDTQLKRFLLESAILKEPEIRKLSRMFYGRPYWNMSVVKSAMAKVPGFKERDFDREFGVGVTYQGDGQVTRITPSSVGRLLRIGLAQRKILKDRDQTAQILKEELLGGYDSVLAGLADLTGRDLKAAWIRLVRDLYLKSEGTYFWQIFINTIHQSINRDAVMKYANLESYYALISGLTNVSHLRPFYEMWELSRTVRTDEADAAYWLNHSTQELCQDLLDSSKTDHYLPNFREILARYDYHSDRELDISWPDYNEDPRSFVQSFCDTLALPDEFSPDAGKLKVHGDYLAALAQISATHGKSVRDKIQQKIDKTRTMLWWREEFRDISTRYYHLIRLYSMKLGEELTKEELITDPSDIWFLKMTDTIQLLEGNLSPAHAQGRILQNRDYYESFRNFMSDNEIGEDFKPLPQVAEEGILLRGLPASHGRIKGVARVISGLEEMDRIHPGDILVTKFTDTGWTSKFAMLGGVITEFGGALCHAAIVSREYGIPCIIGARDAMRVIKDGEMITMDGATGLVQKEDN